jgi:hypothetical protein
MPHKCVFFAFTAPILRLLSGLQITAYEKSPELITLALVTLGSFDFSGTIIWQNVTLPKLINVWQATS